MATYQKVNTGTGFRSGSGDTGASNVIDVNYQNPFEIPVMLPDQPPPSADSGNDSSSVIPGRPDIASETAKDYVNKYNAQIEANNQFGPGGMMQANIDNPVANPTDFYGNPIAKEMYGPEFNPYVFVPGGGFMALNQPAIPTSGYGTPGTYSSLSGGKFNAAGQAIDPITGQPIAEYATIGAFGQSLLDDPLANTSSPQGKLDDMAYAGATSELASIKDGTTDPMGNPETTGLNEKAKQLVAQQLGQEMGFAAHTVAPGTATNQAIATNSTIAGSQYSPTGTFTNQSDDGNEGQGGTQGGGLGQSNSTATSGGYGGFADDAAASDSGGGGGGGGGCVIATHGVSTGGFTVMEKTKAELWCQKTYHGKWYGEAFRKGYRDFGLKRIKDGTVETYYQEFKDFVGYGRRVKKGWKLAFNYYYRTITFFIKGLFIGDK